MICGIGSATDLHFHKNGLKMRTNIVVKMIQGLLLEKVGKKLTHQINKAIFFSNQI